MSSMDMLDVGQANELKLACRRNGFTAEDLKWLCQGDMLSDLVDVRRGDAKISKVRHFIHCEREPFVPANLRLGKHVIGPYRKGFYWDPGKVKLHLDDLQRGRMIDGDLLLEKLEGMPVVNARVLDYLVDHPHLIPDLWKGRHVHFWGTQYRDVEGSDELYVRYLYWGHDRDEDSSWRSASTRVEHRFDGLEPAAMFTCRTV